MNNELPDSWVTTTVGEVYQVTGGGTPATGNPDYWNGDTPWITSADIEGVRQINVRKYVSERGIAESTTNRVPARTLLVVTRVGLGKIAIAETPICFSQDLQGLIQNPELICPEYTLYLLSYELQFLKFDGRGTTISGVTKKQLKDLVFPLPPLNEQHRIVAKIEELFSELDKGVENLKSAQAQLKVYRQALLKHAFEGKLTAQWRREQDQDQLEAADALQRRIQQERAQRYQQQLADWEANGKQGSKPKAPKPLPPLTAEELAELPELPEGWAWTRFGLLDIELRRGPFGSAITKSMFFPSGFKVYEQGNAIYRDALRGSYFIDAKKFEELSGFSVLPGDFIVSCAGTVGKIFELPANASAGVINQALMRVRINESILSKRFFAKLFESGFFQRKVLSDAKGTAMVNLAGIKELNLVPVAICGVSEQKIIDELLDARMSEVDQLELTLTTSLQQAEALRQSILKRAFSGQLVAQDANDEPASVLLERLKAEKAAQTSMAKPRKTKQTAPAPEKSNVIPFPVRLPNISATDLHAGILARAYQHHENTPKYLACFGHVKAEKIAHLVEAHLGIDLEREPIKDAAGPNDYPHLMKVESRARKANWFDVKKKKDADAYAFSKKHGFDALLLKTMKALGERADEVDVLINLLLPLNSRQAEIVATLYAAWNNLLLQGQSPDDEVIVHEARENWHASKLKIERDKFFRGLQWMREKGLVPSGKGRYVGAKAQPETTRKPL